MTVGNKMSIKWNFSFLALRRFLLSCTLLLAAGMRVIRCNIPVIVMGETGCGKTRLIKFMCDLSKPPGAEATNMILMKVMLKVYLSKYCHELLRSMYVDLFCCVTRILTAFSPKSFDFVGRTTTLKGYIVMCWRPWSSELAIALYFLLFFFCFKLRLVIWTTFLNLKLKNRCVFVSVLRVYSV